MSCILQHPAGIFFQNLYIPLPGGPVQHAGLTETAATDTASLDLQHHPVLSHFNKRNHRGFRIRSRCYIHHHLLVDPLPGMRIYRRKRGQCSVFMVGSLVEERHVDPFNLRCSLQVVLSGTTTFFHFLIGVQQLVVDRLSLSDIEKVKEFCQRLRIVGAGSPSDHNGVFPGPVRGVQRDPGQIQDLQDIGITHLILDGDPQEVKVPDGILGLQGEKRDLLLTHNGVQIRPGGVHPLAPYVLPAVEHIIEDLDPQMRHADLINVGKTHGKADVHLVFIFHHRVHLSADVAGRLLDLH